MKTSFGQSIMGHWNRGLMDDFEDALELARRWQRLDKVMADQEANHKTHSVVYGGNYHRCLWCKAQDFDLYVKPCPVVSPAVS